ncbi:MAG: AmmeMemoRadiSam system protein A [Bacillota bacterium]
MGKEMEDNQVVKLAEKAVREYVKNGREIDPPSELPEIMEERKGVFVSIKKNGNLRGCIGTTRPTQKNVAEEIIKNAISACSRDPRFKPVQPEELSELNISVDILGDNEPVASLEELDPDKYGVIVKKGSRTGLLLPDLEGIETVEKQVIIAKKKAGISPAETNIDLFKFKVHRFE